MTIRFTNLPLRGAVLALVLTAAAAPASAGPQATDTLRPGARAGRAGGQRPPGAVVAMLDAYAGSQAQQALGLDDQRAPEFLARLKTLQEARRKAQQGRLRGLQDLRRLAGDRAETQYDEGAVRERLNAIREQDEKDDADIARALSAVDEVLDVRQQARFRLFEGTIERRKLDLIMRARQAARKGAARP